MNFRRQLGHVSSFAFVLFVVTAASAAGIKSSGNAATINDSTRVPEPASLALLGGGLLSVSAVARRLRRSASR